jgi:hypothetical protein
MKDCGTCNLCKKKFTEKNIHEIASYEKLLLLNLFEYNSLTTFKVILSEERNIFGAKFKEDPFIILCKKCFTVYKQTAFNRFEILIEKKYENFFDFIAIDFSKEIPKINLEKEINAFDTKYIQNIDINFPENPDSERKILLLPRFSDKKKIRTTKKITTTKEKTKEDLKIIYPPIRNFNINLINSLFL